METNWEMISAIGTCVGAFATFCACLVALWQTKTAFKKKVKVYFNELIYFNHPIIPKNECRFVGASIVNKGNREVNIREWAIELKNNKKSVLILNYNKSYLTKLPVKIQPEEKVELYYEWSFFENNIHQLIKDHLIKENRRLKFSVTDMTDHKYYFYSQNIAEYYIKGTQNGK